MRRIVAGSVGLFIACALSTPVAAQLAASSGARLMALTLDGAGGDVSSFGNAAHLALGDLSSGELTSGLYRASIGFLAANDPQVTASPIVFGLSPDHGAIGGGTLVTVSGANLDGQGGSVAAWLGDEPVGLVVVSSPNVIQFQAPPGVSGFADLFLSSDLGDTQVEDAFLYTPAITSPSGVQAGDQLALENWGPPGDRYVTFVSATQQEVQTAEGTLLVGPHYVQLISPRRYPAPNGIARFVIDVPADASLVGLTFHFQSLDIARQPPFTAQLTNATSVTIH